MEVNKGQRCSEKANFEKNIQYVDRNNGWFSCSFDCIDRNKRALVNSGYIDKTVTLVVHFGLFWSFQSYHMTFLNR